MESRKAEPISHRVTGKPDSVSHPVPDKADSGSQSHPNSDEPEKITASDSSPASSDEMEYKTPEPISRRVPGKPESFSHPVPAKAKAGSLWNLMETGEDAATDSPPACSSRMESRKREHVSSPPAEKLGYVSHSPSRKGKSVFHRNLQDTGKPAASESSPVSSLRTKPRKSEPGKEIASASFPASNHKYTSSGDGVTEEQDLPPRESTQRSSISSDVSYLTQESSPREEKAIMCLPAPVEMDPRQEVMVRRSSEQDSLALVVIDEYAGDVDGGAGGSRGSENRRRLKERLSTMRRSQREKMLKKAALGFRVFGFMLCLVSLSVMVADRKQGWAIDSFELYKEFRYSTTVNAIGFVYSGAQAIGLIYHLATGRNAFHHPFRHLFDFTVDQVITYLLISASSSAATRVDEWRSNWGNDRFPDMASASVTVSFFAFLSLAFSSIISGYVLCTSRSMHI
ncbi:unnamed protein product [Cuscuta europaea]|uniref:CASP-like protein n=1 Tax=Cuscuta europaea TaxID=41803 RepID=A0A9P1E9Y7_CUSEU|nr:unnamed protein product [Cuscuta europaea]